MKYIKENLIEILTMMTALTIIAFIISIMFAMNDKETCVINGTEVICGKEVVIK